MQSTPATSFFCRNICIMTPMLAEWASEVKPLTNHILFKMFSIESLRLFGSTLANPALSVKESCSPPTKLYIRTEHKQENQ